MKSEMNNKISAITIISILLIANPNKYTVRVNSWTEVFIFAKKVTLVASLFPFLAFKSLRAPTQISLVIINAPIKPIK